MGVAEILNMTLAAQVALGGGYLAYATAYAGLRRGHATEDAVFITFAFGIFASLAFGFAQPRGVPLAVLAGVGSALLAAVVWRMCGRSLWQSLIEGAGVHDDGIATAWDGLIQSPGQMVQQVSVRLRDGRILRTDRRDPFLGQRHGGLILGRDGDIVLVVETELAADGTIRHPPHVLNDDGIRLTYVPASEIVQINLRVR